MTEAGAEHGLPNKRRWWFALPHSWLHESGAVASRCSAMQEGTPEHPLCAWTLTGFRSIRDSTQFSLGGLNLLVGANSAGKSSVLHSLLMTAQTLGSPLSDRPLVLNGPMVRLGLAEDTVHEEAGGRIQIGFRVVRPPSYARSSRRYGDWAFKALDVNAEFAMSRDGIDFEFEDARITAESLEADAARERVVIARRTQTAAEREIRGAGLTGREVRELARRYSMSARAAFPSELLAFACDNSCPSNSTSSRTSTRRS